MNITRSLVRFVSPFLVACGVLLGLALPRLGLVLAPTVFVWLSILMYYAALQMNQPHVVIRQTMRPGLLVGPLVVVFLGIPGLMLGLGTLLRLPESVRASLVLASSAPCMIVSSYVTRLLKGSVDVAFSITAVTTLISPIAVPVVNLYLVRLDAGVDLLTVAISMVFIITAPTALAMLLRRHAPRVADLTRKWERVLSYASIVGVNWVFIGANQASFLHPFNRDFLALLLATFFQTWGLYGLFRLVGRYLVPEGESKALAATLVLKNVALVGGTGAAIQSALSLVAAMYSLINSSFFAAVIIHSDEI